MYLPLQSFDINNSLYNNIILSLCCCLNHLLAYVLGQMQHEAAIPQLIEVCTPAYKMSI